MKRSFDLTEIEEILHHLNYRWNLTALATWKGEKSPIATHRLYDTCDDFLSPDTLPALEALGKGTDRHRLKHAFIDHYLQRQLLPHELETQTWMRGASARVNGEKIRFQEIVSWCQQPSTYKQRQALQKETRSLCRFLKPFMLNHWQVLLTALREELGFRDYLDYCRQKKEIDYDRYYSEIRAVLEATDALYFPAMSRWCRSRFGRPLDELTWFDAVHLMSLREFDALLPAGALKTVNRFFRYWGIDLENLPGLHLEMNMETANTAQGLSIFLGVPDEVYVLMQPSGGWIDLETLWHELGHGLSAVFTAPDLSRIERDMNTDFSLSESYAFLIQNIALSPLFLTKYLGLSRENAGRLYYHKIIRDLAAFRRYAAKFLAEYEIFSAGDMADGEPYARTMRRYTGFYYMPESHLFDLTPELYSLDYVLGWMAEALLADHLKARMGKDWICQPGAGRILKKWWRQGNRCGIFLFLKRNGLGQLQPEPLLRRWADALKP